MQMCIGCLSYYYCCNICPFHIVIFSSNYHECVIMLFFFLNLFISMDILFFQQLTRNDKKSEHQHEKLCYKEIPGHY